MAGGAFFTVYFLCRFVDFCSNNAIFGGFRAKKKRPFEKGRLAETVGFEL